MKNKKSQVLFFGISFFVALSFLFFQKQEAFGALTEIYKYKLTANNKEYTVPELQALVVKNDIRFGISQATSASGVNKYSAKCIIYLHGRTPIAPFKDIYFKSKGKIFEQSVITQAPLGNFDACHKLFIDESDKMRYAGSNENNKIHKFPNGSENRFEFYVYKGVPADAVVTPSASSAPTGGTAAPAVAPASGAVAPQPASGVAGNNVTTPAGEGSGAADSSAGGTGTGDAGAGGGQTSTTNSMGGIVFANPLGVNSLEEFLMLILGKLRGLVGLLAVLFIVIGGIMYIFSGVDQGMAEKGKKTVTYAVIGLAIALGANTFLVEIYNILGISGATGLSLYQIAEKILTLALSLVGILAIIGIVIGGMFYFGAGVSEKSVDKGKKIVTASVIGLLMALSAVIIVREVVKLMT